LWDRIKEQPARVLQLLQAFVGMAVALQWVNFTPNQTAAVLAVASTMLNLALALAVRQFVWPLVTAFVQAAIPLALEFGWWAVDDQATATIYSFVALVGVVLLPSRLNPETKLPPLQAVEVADGVFEVQDGRGLQLTYEKRHKDAPPPDRPGPNVERDPRSW
jgi:hypothetical protein